MNGESHKFFKIMVNGKEVGKYGLSFYPDIKAVGIGSFEIFRNIVDEDMLERRYRK